MNQTTTLSSYRRAERLMGNQFILTAVSGNNTDAEAALEEAVNEIRRIEALLTTFSNDSVTAQINGAAGDQPVPVPTEVYALIERSLRISGLTQGAFDISYGSIDKRLWNFDRHMTALPDPAEAKERVRLINYRNIILDPESSTVFLREKGMRIGFGGIGKGYAAEQAKAVLLARGVQSGVVNASGDLCAWGTQPDGTPWTVGIAAPEMQRQPFARFLLRDGAVATSGDYEKFVLIGGRRYSHTIDPRTGYPVGGIKSVTIFCPNAEIADALATPVLVMGIRAGLDLINQLRDVECLLIDEQDRVHCSQNIKWH
ncbi:MAG: FAD:protein FMN transferase [Chitinophagaceae bacterium]|nr:MAG: FAD:protein FMN transferase [Chitinophagaceae bacterium]